MSHTYLIELYELIDQRLEEVQKEIRLDVSPERETRFQEGRTKVLTEFKEFLATHYNRKLPRRLQQRYESP